MASGGAVKSPEAARPAAVALDFTDGETSPSPARIPRRIRRRLLEGRSTGPASVQEIEAKLRDADLRRQQFHEWLSSKAKPKPRSPSWSSQEEDPGQKLEAKLVAAEQKRLSLLANAQMRLARLDEQRQAAKSGVKIRFEKERKELGTRVESRVQQAKENRMRLLKAHMQRRAAIQERTARSLLQRINRENRYKECVRSAIFQKRAAAEKNRMVLLEEEKKRAQAKVVQARRVAKTVCHRRETERRRIKEQLENRLQKARRQRTEILKQRGSPHNSGRINLTRHGEYLSRQLTRCWRRFVTLRRTTFALAKAFDVLGLNEKSVKHMPFEQVALLMESTTTLETTKALLDRLETRFSLLLSSDQSCLENIDHLLKRVASPNKKVTSNRTMRQRVATKRVIAKESRSSETKMARYPVRVVLCAYMILGHPNAVFSGQGEREVALRDSAKNFIQQFELLVKIILDGPSGTHLSRQSTSYTSLDSHCELPSGLPQEPSFRHQLRSFDSAWCAYLYRFVVWKVKDARSLEEDLVRAACQLEVSMMQTCKMNADGQTCDLSHDMRAIQKQVIEDQKLLREKVQHLSGNAGIERMESALNDARSKFFEAKDNGSPFTHISLPSVPHSVAKRTDSVPHAQSGEDDGKSRHVARSLFSVSPSTLPNSGTEVQSTVVQSSSASGKQLPTENELLVNEIMHWGHGPFANDLDLVKVEELSIQVKETMERAFWDGILDSLRKDVPDYSRLLGLVKEVRDELCDLAPQSWKQDILNSIDVDILSQVLESGSQDTDYLGNILEYVLVVLQKLSAPASEEAMRKEHQKLLRSLADIASSNDKQNQSFVQSFVIAAIKGLRFVLDEIQTLKTEVSLARIKLMEPIIKGSAGLEYLQKAFTDRYGTPVEAANTMPQTLQWLQSYNFEEEWNEHNDLCSVLSASHGLPVAALRTGAGLVTSSRHDAPSTTSASVDELPECSGEKVEKLVRIGLVKLATAIEGATPESIPETLKLNISRLRTVQSQIQQIIVTATSILVLRQVLSEHSVSSSELEAVISDTVKKLHELLKSSADVGIQDITETMMISSKSCSDSMSEEKLQSRKEMIARVLTKSLQNDDAVFGMVFRSIYMALRGIVLGGSGSQGLKLADAALRRIGAAMLLQNVVDAGSTLIMMAIVTSCVHRPWYNILVQSFS